MTREAMRAIEIMTEIEELLAARLDATARRARPDEIAAQQIAIRALIDLIAPGQPADLDQGYRRRAAEILALLHQARQARSIKAAA